MVDALCNPPVDTKVQVAMWDTSSLDKSHSCEAFADFIGLRYQLDPVIFRAIANDAHASVTHKRGIDRLATTHAKLGKTVATLCHQ